MKRLDAKHAGVELGVRFEKFTERAAGNIVATRERKVRMPRSQFRLQADLKRRFLHAFVKLKQMRMTRADADPDNFYHSSRRKCADSVDRQKERAKFNRVEFFAQGEIDILGDVGKKTEGEMNLVRGSPAHAANSGVQVNEKRSN